MAKLKMRLFVCYALLLVVSVWIVTYALVGWFHPSFDQGTLSPIWPLLLVLYFFNAFGKAGSVLLIAAPLATLVTVIEGIARGGSLVLPLISFAVSVMIVTAILQLILRD